MALVPWHLPCMHESHQPAVYAGFQTVKSTNNVYKVVFAKNLDKHMSGEPSRKSSGKVARPTNC